MFYGRLLLALLAVVVVDGCGSMHHYVPPIPPGPGEVMGRIGLSWSSSKFSSVALQGNLYVGMSNRDLLGIGFNNFIMPTSLSYVHYAGLRGTEEDYINIQLHGSFIGPDPRYEADLGYGLRRGDVEHGFTLGLGYVGTPVLGLGSSGGGSTRPMLVPVAGYDLSYNGFMMGILTSPGLSRSIVRALGEHAGASLSSPDDVIVLPRDRIASIEPLDRGSARSPADQEWLIRLGDGSTIYLSRRAPGYNECIFCTTPFHDQDIYADSLGYRNYTVVRDWHEGGGALQGVIMQLNMAHILRRYDTTGVLRIEPDPDALERILEVITPGLDDLSIGVGYGTRGE